MEQYRCISANVNSRATRWNARAEASERRRTIFDPDCFDMQVDPCLGARNLKIACGVARVTVGEVRDRVGSRYSVNSLPKSRPTRLVSTRPRPSA
jgi:hypothetical protein